MNEGQFYIALVMGVVACCGIPGLIPLTDVPRPPPWLQVACFIWVFLWGVPVWLVMARYVGVVP